MRYISIELKGYKRLSLNKIECIRLEPEQKFHWILGTNGSGKSSLLREISPLSAVPNEYHKGGHKKIHLEYKGKEYKLTSDFSGPKNIFSFIVLENGEEVEKNPGHTSTVFNNLVLQYFGYTKEVRDYGLGIKEFTRMSLVDRKQWLTKLSSVDYTFALNYFKKLTKSYRDLTGSIETDHKRLVEARQHLVPPEQIKALEERISALKEQLHYLNSVCPNPDIPFSEANRQFEAMVQKLQQSRLQQKQILLRSKELLPLEASETLSVRTQQLQGRLQILEDNRNRLFKTLEDHRQQMDLQAALHGDDQKTLEISIVNLNTQIEELETQLTNGIAPNPSLALSQFHSWLSETELVVGHLVPDLNLELTEENHALYAEKLRRAVFSLSQLDAQKTKIRKDLENAEECSHNPTVQCPSCSYQWIPGHSETHIRQLETLLVDLETKIHTVQKQIDHLSEQVEVHQRFEQGQKHLNNLVWKYPEFKGFWENIFHEKDHLLAPEVIVGKAFGFKSQLETMVLIQNLKEQKDELFRKMDLLKNMSQLSVSMLYKENKQASDALELCFSEIETVTKEISFLDRKAKLSGFLEKLRVETEKDKETLDRLFQLRFEHHRRAGLSDLMLQTNAELLQIEKQIRSAEVQQGQIDMLESNLETTKQHAKVLKAAVDVLSPSTGLIAKGLTGFINHFVSLTNQIIQKVWLYPMALIPVLPDEDDQIDLDFRFMVQVKDEKVPDIEQCSSGQQEIINLATRIVGLTFLGHDHGPLFLDEFGARMDTAHKASAFEMITKLLVHSNFTQIFMISHFEGTQTAGLEADLTVLCPANIQLPPGVTVNRTTTIT